LPTRDRHSALHGGLWGGNGLSDAGKVPYTVYYRDIICKLMETGAAPQGGLVTDTGLPELDTVPF
jgi:hypothetical protein